MRVSSTSFASKWRNVGGESQPNATITRREFGMHTCTTIAGVFGLSAGKFMMGVALGATLRLPFYWQVFCTGGGGVAGVFLTAYTGDAVRSFLRQRFGKKRKALDEEPELDAVAAAAAAEEAARKRPLALRVWDRWGLAGLAAVGTITLGPVVAVLTALSLGAPRARVLSCMTIAVMSWSILFGGLSALAPGLLPLPK
jgi:hypothetical protein